MARRRAADPACPATAYARAVVAGTVLAGRPVRLAAKRHLDDLETGAARGLKFDREKAAHALRFFSFLKLVDGSPFKLQPFQEFVVGSLFGWLGSDGYRRFRTAYIEVAKGGGKTPLAAAAGLYGLVADGEMGAEIYSAAVTKEQASILFRDAKLIAENSESLSSLLEIGQYNLACHATASFFRPVSSEHRNRSGPRPHMGLIDELHEHPTALMADKIRAGTKGRKQALVIETTNAGYDRNTVCWHHHEYSLKVLEGIEANDSWFAYVCALDPCDRCREEGKDQPTEDCPNCDDWKDEACWPKANPGLGSIIPIKYLREQVKEAVGMPSKESIVKRLNFCIWVNVAVRAIPIDKWDACAHRRLADEIGCAVGTPALRIAMEEAVRGRPCYGALDIGATSDFTAFVRLFPHDDAQTVEAPADPSASARDEGEAAPPRKIVRRTYTMLANFWLPESPVRRDERTTELIALWRRMGWLKTTPGEVVDYDVAIEDIIELNRRTPLLKIGLDYGFQGVAMATNLAKVFGDKIVIFRQGIVSMNAPFRELLELVRLGRLLHDGNPVMRWMAGNVASEQRGGLIKPSKEKSPEKIDGITAATMCLGIASGDAGAVQSVYETRGLAVVGPEPSGPGPSVATVTVYEDEDEDDWP